MTLKNYTKLNQNNLNVQFAIRVRQRQGQQGTQMNIILCCRRKQPGNSGDLCHCNVGVAAAEQWISSVCWDWWGHWTVWLCVVVCHNTDCDSVSREWMIPYISYHRLGAVTIMTISWFITHNATQRPTFINQLSSIYQAEIYFQVNTGLVMVHILSYPASSLISQIRRRVLSGYPRVQEVVKSESTMLCLRLELIWAGLQFPNAE